MDLLEATPAFIHCQEGSDFRGTDISSCRQSIGALLFVDCREVVPFSESPFKEIPLYTSSIYSSVAWPMST